MIIFYPFLFIFMKQKYSFYYLIQFIYCLIVFLNLQLISSIFLLRVYQKYLSFSISLFTSPIISFVVQAIISISYNQYYIQLVFVFLLLFFDYLFFSSIITYILKIAISTQKVNIIVKISIFKLVLSFTNISVLRLSFQIPIISYHHFTSYIFI